nr:putative integron gene cassette protein [uncultured bacterium]
MRLRRVFQIIAAFVSVLVLAFALVIWFLFFRGCGGNQEAAREMRELPEERLKSLYQYAKGLQGNGSYQLPVMCDEERDPVPRELADLKPKSIQFFGDTLGIHISGCWDDKVYLFIEGLDPKDGRPKIVLSPGERNGTETLWPE